MKIEFLFNNRDMPRKATRNVTAYETVAIGEYTLLKFPKKNVYYDRKSNKVKIIDCDFFDGYFIKIAENVFGHAGNVKIDKDVFSIDNIQELLKNEFVTYKNLYENFEKIVKQREQENLLKIENENRERSLLISKQQEEKILKDQAHYETVLNQYKENQFIEWTDFELLCKKYGITINIRTLGAARKNVTVLAKDGRYKCYTTLDSICVYIKELNQAIEEEFMEIDPEVEALFGINRV